MSDTNHRVGHRTRLDRELETALSATLDLDLPRLPVVPGAASAVADAARILFIVRGTESYGTATKILGLLEGLADRGVAVRVYALGEGHLVSAARALPALPVTVDPAVPPRFEAHRTTRLAAFTRTLGSSPPFMLHLAAYLRREPCDALVFCEHGLALQLGLLARLAGVPAFWIMANSIATRYPLDLNRRIYAFAFRHLAIVPVANSEHTRRTLGRGAGYASKIDLGINPDRVLDHAAAPAPTPAPLPLDAAAPGPLDAAAPGPLDAAAPGPLDAAAPGPLGAAVPGRVRLLVMSRLVESKGHLVLLRALLSRPAFADVDLFVCGGPLGTPYVEALRREAADRGASGRLHLLGPVADVTAYYRAADIVVSARLDPEPFGLSIVEAMLAGKPVLAHASGGPVDIVVDGVTGWHIDAPTEAAFAAGLARMLRDRADWPRIGAAGLARARQNYTHTRMADQLLAVIAARLRRQ